MDERRELDQLLLEIYEDLTKHYKIGEEKLSGFKADYSLIARFAMLGTKLNTERRLLEEISLPARLILEHLTCFMGSWEQVISFKVGSFLEGRASLIDFSVDEWGNIVLNLGQVHLTWRDEDYKYLFYPDKVILRSYDTNKPEIFLDFNFYFKHSHVLHMFANLQEHSQVEYWHADLNL